MKLSVAEAREQCPQFDTVMKEIRCSGVKAVDLTGDTLRIYFWNDWELEFPVSQLHKAGKVIRNTCEFRKKDHRCPRLRIR